MMRNIGLRNNRMQHSFWCKRQGQGTQLSRMASWDEASRTQCTQHRHTHTHINIYGVTPEPLIPFITPFTPTAATSFMIDHYDTIWGPKRPQMIWWYWVKRHFSTFVYRSKVEWVSWEKKRLTASRPKNIFFNFGDSVLYLQPHSS